jgi:hypothetical protein
MVVEARIESSAGSPDAIRNGSGNDTAQVSQQYLPGPSPQAEAAISSPNTRR